jgi:hypothetical protein
VTSSLPYDALNGTRMETTRIDDIQVATALSDPGIRERAGGALSSANVHHMPPTGHPELPGKQRQIFL